MNILRRRMLAGKTEDPFGDASLGNVVISSNQTWYADTVDTGVIERQYKTLTINSGVTITAGNRNSGIILRVRGDCIINGAIVNRMAPRSHSADLSRFYPPFMIRNGRGGNGGNGKSARTLGSSSSAMQVGGNGQVGRIYGGGYSAGGAGGTSEYGWSSGYRGKAGGRGGNATDITVNTSIFQQTQIGESGSVDGSHGSGGTGAYPYAGSTGETIVKSHGTPGASGNGAGADGQHGGYDYTSSHNYGAGGGGGNGNIGGGVIIIFCGGRLIVNGQILCHGSNGGNGGGIGAFNYVPGAGGGGSGGGRIFLLAKVEIQRNGTFNVSGGFKGDGGLTDSGGDGTAGDKHYQMYRDYKKGLAPISF